MPIELAPAIVHRFGVAKAGWVREWAWLAAVASMLAAVALALRTVLKVKP